MNLLQLIEEYIKYRQTLGENFQTNARVLRTYARFVGEKRNANSAKTSEIKDFVDGDGPVTNSRRKRFDALKGLYRYACSRGFIGRNPMPPEAPKLVPSLVPYIYEREEIRALLRSPITYRYKTQSAPETTSAVLLLLYGTGLRVREAIALDDDDVDLKDCVVTVRKTKFCKSRLVPFGKHLQRALRKYVKTRTKSSTDGSPFFTSRTGGRLNQSTFTKLFRRLCIHAGITREDARYQPRLHDLRHTFAVHRLTTWYQQGADVQRLLPKLSTYLGHVNISGTQVYLSMTPELLRAAGNRFSRYAAEEMNHG